MKEKELNYAYVIYALAFLMIFVGLGFGNTRVLYIQSVCDGLNVSRGVLSLSDSIRFITTALMSFAFGFLISKLGQRIMIATGFLCLTGAMLTYSFAPNIYIYFIGSMLLGMGLSLTGTAMVGSIMNSWCDKNKGTITGFILAASGVGGATSTQIISPLIESGANGYRKAYFISSIIILLTGIVIFLLFRNKGTAVVNKKQARNVGWEGIAFQEALKRPYFYVCIACIFFTGFALQGMTGTSTQHMKDVFKDPVYVSNILSGHMLVLTATKFLTGFIYDKKGLKVTFCICAIAGVASLMLLTFMKNNAMGKGFALVEAVISCVATPLETIMLPIFTAEFFGPKSFNKALGIISAFNVAGYAAGSFVIGIICDITGSYATGYFIYGIIMVAVFLMMQYVISASRKERLKSAE